VHVLFICTNLSRLGKIIGALAKVPTAALGIVAPLDLDIIYCEKSSDVTAKYKKL